MAQDIGNNDNPSPSKTKSCAYCKKRGHLRERCFLWLETPDGTKWAAKNPYEADKIRKFRDKLARRKRKERSESSQLTTRPDTDTDTDQPGVWVMEEYAMITQSTKGLEIVLDTGATNHVFNDRSLFSSISPCDKYILSASG
ncbi:hypothetical protein EV44_g3249 [Erysiphe necator]|uniref:Uncharacterized protein n=1 Tax=Uncinula necator TaxID=52586 RepID=A0A0B1P5P6_UNCNE|nr:hypothetical protein EV44_g3249 [Erysiphe necator]